MPFSVEPGSDIGTWRLVGELDRSTADQLIEQLGPSADQNGELRLDLSGLQFIDSAGIDAVRRLCELRADREPIVLESAASAVRAPLQLIGADTLTNLVTDGERGSTAPEWTERSV